MPSSSKNSPKVRRRRPERGAAADPSDEGRRTPAGRSTGRCESPGGAGRAGASGTKSGRAVRRASFPCKLRPRDPAPPSSLRRPLTRRLGHTTAGRNRSSPSLPHSNNALSPEGGRRGRGDVPRRPGAGGVPWGGLPLYAGDADFSSRPEALRHLPAGPRTPPAPPAAASPAAGGKPFTLPGQGRSEASVPGGGAGITGGVAAARGLPDGSLQTPGFRRVRRRREMKEIRAAPFRI